VKIKQREIDELHRQLQDLQFQVSQTETIHLKHQRDQQELEQKSLHNQELEEREGSKIKDADVSGNFLSCCFWVEFQYDSSISARIDSA
jgi:hypothetical protein